MNKEWRKTSESSYSFFIDNMLAGTLSIDYNQFKKAATFKTGNNEFVINRAGFWGSGIEVIDANGKTILKMYGEKWYANSFIVEYMQIQYKLFIRNNPLAEWVIKENDADILSYGLYFENGKGAVRINSGRETSDYIFHFLLWYLFVPVASENLGGNLYFINRVI